MCLFSINHERFHCCVLAEYLEQNVIWQMLVLFQLNQIALPETLDDSLSLWGPCQGCNTVIVRLLSEDVSNESPSPSSYLFTQPLHVSPFQ